ncbi:hypothetical protein [Paraburkholderia sp. JHI869]|uniref:hypothetical protein n=1 Tax=Paraburkholderia sp. JHI869 TaxID=3112959 RepID=UPI003177BE0E
MYATLYLKASTFLPEFVFRDSDKIQSQIGGSSTYQDTSFDAVSKFYSSLGDIGTTVFVVGVGALFIGMMIGYSKRLGSLLVNTVLLAPCVFFNLFVASKDTLVVLISVLLVMIARRYSLWYVMAASVALYVGYAATVRIYFVLILAIGAGAWVFRKVGLRGKLLLLVAVFTVLFALPDIAYYALLHPRDMAVDYLVTGSPYGARTGFYNPLPPQSFWAFCADYLYAVAKLHVPFLFSPGPKELVMTALMGIVLGAIFYKPAQADPRIASVNWLACLLIGHMAVSMLFEPDLGSYTRHLTSAALYAAWRLSLLVPATRRMALLQTHVPRSSAVLPA